MDIQSVFTENQNRQRRARQLNLRAGKMIFPVFDKETIREMLQQLLPGVKSVGEIENPDALLLPALDEEMVALVEEEYPESIELLGMMCRIEYREGYTPSITLNRESIANHGWRNLPDEGVKLPGGRTVEIIISFGIWNVIRGTDIPHLKRLCSDRADNATWENWSAHNRPELTLPDLTDSVAEIPKIVKYQYGTSAIDDSPLIAYGSLVPRGYRHYASDPYFDAKWFRNRIDAENARSDCLIQIDGIRREAIAEKKRAELSIAIENAKAELRALTTQSDWHRIDYDVRGEVETAIYAYVTGTPEELQEWVRQANNLIAKVRTRLRMASNSASIATLQGKFNRRR